MNSASRSDAKQLPQLLPADEHNRLLESNVRPRSWVNPKPDKPYHLVVIGAGTAGLVTAAGAAGLGARVALIERELMGGDCLNVGCVPSKGIIGTARAAAAVRRAATFGVDVPGSMTVDFSKTMERMRRLRAQISPNDSVERFSKMGVDVYLGQGAFVDVNTISITEDSGKVSKIGFKKAVIASGARALAPPIEGLDTVSFLTNENLFSLTELPERLGIVGTGPIGCEMAQSFARFGSKVFLYGRSDFVLPKEDPQASATIAEHFKREDIRLMLGSKDMKLSPTPDKQIRILVKQNGQPSEVVVDKLLVAVGRAPNVERLNLDSVNVKYDQSGVSVNDFLQTTNPRIYAAGDICSKHKFTHAADFQARIVIQNSLFALGPIGRKKASRLVVPWATYTSPEVAQVGLTQNEAANSGLAIDTYTQDLSDVDRAILEGVDSGFVKVHTKQGTDKIVGATIVAENAGDLISEITLAMNNGLGLSAIGSTIHPYPTQAEAIRKLGDQYNKTRLTPFGARILGLLKRINVGT